MKINYSPVTFKSHYRFFTNSATNEAQTRLVKMQNEEFQYRENPSNDIGLLTQGICGECFVSAKDKYDKKIENILISRGIKFEKTPLDIMRSQDSVLSRIEQRPADRSKDDFLLDIDPEKFDKIFQKSQQYIGKFGKGGIDNRYSEFIKYMESGMPIYASTVVIREENNKPVISFVDGRHRYCVMRDLGFDRIPISIDEESMQVAQKYCLLK